jgi:lysophospholipase L1-like esterase
MITPRLRLAFFVLITAAVITPAGADTVVDPNLAQADPNDSTLWYDIRHLGVEGKGWDDTMAPFDRLPAKAEGVVRPPVWSLSRHSAGMCVRFETDATTIRARWTLTSSGLAMPHMPATGVSGLDLYVKTNDDRWRWLATGRPTKFPTNEAKLISGIPAGKRQYWLYLPLYNGVSSVEIGVPQDCTLSRLPRPAGRRRPIMFWGTSITQGGCASRTGMVHTAILGRRLDRPVINLGFSGNGKMEPEMAQLVAELDAAVFVIDCLPNMVAAEVAERVEPLVQILRKAHPQTPIVLAEDRTYGNAFLVESSRQRNETSRGALAKAYENLKAAEVPELHYLPGDDQLGDDNLGTVDGSHPTDLGFMRMADAFERVLEPLTRDDDAP